MKAKGRVPPELALCHGCKQFVRQDEVRCPHCGDDIAMAAVRNRERMEQVTRATKELQRLLADLGLTGPL